LHVAGHRVAVGGGPFPCSGFPEPAPVRSSFRRSRSPSLRRLLFEGHPDCSLPSPLPGKPDRVSGSSPGVPQRSPLHRQHHARPLSVARGSGLPLPNSFRPRRSSRPRRLAPRTASRVCCTPQPILGFTRFHADRRRLPTTDAPPSALSPSKLFLLDSREPVSRLRASSPLLSRRTEVRRGGTEVPRSASRPCSVQESRTAGSCRIPSPFGPPTTSLPSGPCRHGRCFELPWGSLDPGSHQSAVPLPGSPVANDPCGSTAPDTLLGAPRPQPKLRTRWPP
jgi:hypothetical protein